jgi:hypothetical protein
MDNRLIKSRVLNGLLLAALVVGTIWAGTTTYDRLKLRDNGIVDSGGTERITIGNPTVINGALLLGVDSSSKTSVGNIDNRVRITPMLLAGTVNAVQGSALVATSTSTSPGAAVAVSAATIDLTTVVGVAKAAATVGSLVYVVDSGFALARTTGTVTPGTVLVTTQAAAGYLAANANSVWGADVGVAITTGTAAGGLTLIKLRK